MLITAADPAHYSQQLAEKKLRVKQLLSEFDAPTVEVFSSPTSAYRMRAEFRLWHEGEDLYYAMFDPAEPKTPVRVNRFDIASERIQRAMPELLEKLKPIDELRRKLFQVEFLSTCTNELLITLIYHRPLEENWEVAARALATDMDVRLIGRSRKQRVVLSEDYVDEELVVDGDTFQYRQFEQGFTQPNAAVNVEMLQWACSNAVDLKGDLLELYCGNGNFSLPLSRHFDSVLATEVSKSSMRAAHYNAQSNGVENLTLVRLSAEEVCEALGPTREFRRLKDVRPLAEFDFTTVFVDPPRAGLDPLTEELVSRFDNIIYISCNPTSLHENLQTITATHRIERLAVFDQFPYTPHIECGVFLKKRVNS
jgi:tRNA (uracil-5-)-methyltransferase